jgi:serine/threonine protein kinase
MMGLTVLLEEPTGKLVVGSAQAESVGPNHRVGETETGYYALENELGRGGMGLVYKARQVKMTTDGVMMWQRPVAIKVIKLDDSLSTADDFVREAIMTHLRKSFLQEVQLAARLDHPNIVRILDFGENFVKGGGPFYVMEYVEGVSLFDMINERGSLGWDQARALMLQICKGIEAAHDHVDLETGTPQPIIHRDIKPENIIIVTDKDGEQIPKVLDFGIAKISEERSEQTHKGDRLPVGTPDYMAPEQALCLTIDPRTDIYAIGGMMYHMLTGRLPYPFEAGVSIEDYLRMKVETDFAPIGESRPDLDISAEAQLMIQKCLEKSPEKRYQSVQELRADLQKSLNGRTGSGEQPRQTPPGIASLGSAEDGPGPRRKTPPRTIHDGEMMGAPVEGSGDPDGKKKRRRSNMTGVLIGAGAAAVLGLGVGALYFSRDRTADGRSEKPPATSAMSPMSEPMREDAGAVIVVPIHRQLDAAPAKKERSVDFAVGIADVSVMVSGTQVCTTSADGVCKADLSRVAPVDVTFKKKGYTDLVVKVLPEQEGEIPIKMERIQSQMAANPMTRPKPPMGGMGMSGTPSITSEE